MAFQAELKSSIWPSGQIKLMSMLAIEALSRPFEIQVEFLSRKSDLKLTDVLGKSMSVELAVDGGQRYFNGLIAQLKMSHRRRRHYFIYEATLRPWFWFLSHTRDSRIFQGKTVLQIIDEVLKDHAGLAQVEKKLGQKTYAQREYCVQYQESDMDFLARLMAQEGIYYYFKHSAQGHTMVLCNGVGSHQSFANYERIPYVDSSTSSLFDKGILKWQVEAQVLPTSVVLSDFDFQSPKAALVQHGKVSRSHPLSQHEVFQYPGAYQDQSVGSHYAKVMAESQQANFLLAAGEADAQGLCCGHVFKTDSLPDDSLDGEYLVRATKTLVAPGFDGADWQQSPIFKCGFQVMPASEVYRPPLNVPQPKIHGPQTAMVVGPKGQPVHTDEHGRVKVLFHWDREGVKTKDEKCSCWVRVSQPWAGNGFGMVNIPRLGDEVVVSFLDADPDRPLITGRVYNGAFKPPYPLPEKASVTGIKTRSMGSDVAAEANELRFDDEKGKEHIWLQAQKDFHRWVKNNDHETIEVDQFKDIKGARQESIGKTYEQTVGGDVNTTYSRDHHHKVAGDWIGEAGTVINLTAGSNVAVAGTNVHVKAGAAMILEAGSSLILKVGGSTVAIGPAGVNIVGPLVKINSGGGGGSASKPAKPKAAKKLKVDKDPLAGGK